ncbi:hypothetical protein E2C01_028774 [Portunus trituberculatus]|uniref:Uncharacterized protein n=1 Tax=Portunus trituberculatus TaxID=210409 RepID=A0A5B7EME7_PORTR|nr:hypothetical protein [Portunus trituberculatus]
MNPKTSEVQSVNQRRKEEGQSVPGQPLAVSVVVASISQRQRNWTKRHNKVIIWKQMKYPGASLLSELKTQAGGRTEAEEEFHSSPVGGMRN